MHKQLPQSAEQHPMCSAAPHVQCSTPCAVQHPHVQCKTPCAVQHPMCSAAPHHAPAPPSPRQGWPVHRPTHSLWNTSYRSLTRYFNGQQRARSRLKCRLSRGIEPLGGLGPTGPLDWRVATRVALAPETRIKWANAKFPETVSRLAVELITINEQTQK